MGFFSRLGTFIKSNLNDMVSQAEDPEKMLHQAVIDMQEQLVEAKKHVAAAITDEKRLKHQVQDAVTKQDDWERKAVLAVRASDDELARQALLRKAEQREAATLFEEQWQAQKKAIEQLKDSLRDLNSKIEEAKRKKNILIARKKRAEAQKAIHQTMAGLHETSAFETFDRMANKIGQLEAEVEASAEVVGELSSAKLERRFAELEAGDADQALLELKAKMGALPAAKPEHVDAAAIDAELHALKARLDADRD